MDDESVMLKCLSCYTQMLLLHVLYIWAESAEGLQRALDAMSDYCDRWSLRINAVNSKMVVEGGGGSRKQVRNINSKQKGKTLEVVFGYQYLGLYFTKMNLTLLRNTFTTKHQGPFSVYRLS